ncbi:MAG: hypothetical protein ACTSUB_03215, partial [Candidatus Thorarchaeota archaeon]
MKVHPLILVTCMLALFVVSSTLSTTNEISYIDTTENEDLTDSSSNPSLQVQNQIHTPSALEYHFVDQLLSGIGDITSFSNMQIDDDNYATITEEAIPVGSENVILTSVTDWSTFPPIGWNEYDVFFSQDWNAIPNYAFVTGDEVIQQNGGLQTDNYSTTDALKVSVEIATQYMLLDAGDWIIYAKDNTNNWDEIGSFSGTEDTFWESFDWSSSDPQYFHSNFQIRFEAYSIDSVEWLRLDDVLISKDVVASYNYRFDRVFQFDSVKGDTYAREWLTILTTNSLDSEECHLYARCGTSGEWLECGITVPFGISGWNLHLTFQLTGETFQLRVVDVNSVGDSIQDTWYVTRMYLNLYEYIPHSYQTPTSSSSYETTPTFYAHKSPSGEFASIVTYHEDSDGATTITDCYIQGKIGSSVLWTVKYNRTSFTEWNLDGDYVQDSPYISITDGSETSAGNRVQVTWNIRFGWNHPDTSNFDISVWTESDNIELLGSTLNEDSYNLNWVVETRLNLVGSAEIDWGLTSTDRCALSATIGCFGDLEYYGSASHVSPNPSSIILKVSRDDDGNPWTNGVTVTPSADGTFSESNILDVKDVVSLNTYTFNIWSSDTTTYGTSYSLSHSILTDEIIADELMIELSIDDSHMNLGQNTTIWATVTYAYDGSYVTDGEVILRTKSSSSDIYMEYDFNIDPYRWFVGSNKSTISEHTYFVYEVTDYVNGLTTVGDIIFDGSGYVDCGTDASLTLPSMTLSISFTCDSWGTGSYLIAKKDGNNAQYALFITSDGDLKFLYNDGDLSEYFLLTGVLRNEWHTIVLTLDGTNLNFWFDGVHEIEDGTLDGVLTEFFSVPLYIGATYNGGTPNYLFDGC